jgi:hypothetical protein
VDTTHVFVAYAFLKEVVIDLKKADLLPLPSNSKLTLDILEVHYSIFKFVAASHYSDKQDTLY